MIGREKERSELQRLYFSGKAELVAVYGRRRVGKTFLIDDTFSDKITFRHAGLAPEKIGDDQSKLKAQLEHFYYSLQVQGMRPENKPKSWLEAFYMLETALQKIDDGNRQVGFLDELPWMDTPKSKFITAFEAFWNSWGCHRKNLMVIVCGSATSWIQDKLINNHGGLYNRLTYEIKLSPFNLRECEEFFNYKNIHLSRYDITQSYMVFGGIPYYLGYFQDGLSLAQNVDQLIFTENAKLKGEYDRLFSSIFVNPDTAKTIVNVLSKRNIGFTRSEITEKTGIEDGGSLSESLTALIASDFIIKYVPFGRGNHEHYKLTDPFCIFYLHFIEGNKGFSANFWQNNISSPSISSWRGFAFENICFCHIRQIKDALGITGVVSQESAWAHMEYSGKKGVQIDLLINRNDNVINMCEMKYYSEKFEVTKDYYEHLLHCQNVLSNEISAKTSIHNTLITTFGLVQNKYSGFFSNTITLEDLFK